MICGERLNIMKNDEKRHSEGFEEELMKGEHNMSWESEGLRLDEML